MYFGGGACFETCFSFEGFVEFELGGFGWKLSDFEELMFEKFGFWMMLCSAASLLFHNYHHSPPLF